MDEQPRERFAKKLAQSIHNQTFIKITLSKPKADTELKNIYGRIVEIKKQPRLSCTFRYKTRDEVKNYDFTEGSLFLNEQIGTAFMNADVWTTEADFSIQIGKKFMIPNIYYDYDKSFIRPEAAKILDKLAIFLKDNPAIKVELGAHTDSRGSDTYNMALSGRRAESAVKYLVERCGVSQANITWKGYGETELVNSCSNKAKCSESEHQLNRRTELKVIAIMEEDPLWNHSLKEIIEDKNLYYKIIKMEKAGQGQPKTGSPTTMMSFDAFPGFTGGVFVG